jgi:uncharacterized cupin superfamily protein
MEETKSKPVAVHSNDVPKRAIASFYPEQFYLRVLGRERKQLGEVFGVKNFGVNLTRMKPNSESALCHRHSKQEEFVFILEGEVTLVTDKEETVLTPGMCAGFVPNGSLHHLINKSDKDVVYLEIGDRTPGDEVEYPNDDLKAEEIGGKWVFTHKDGTPYTKFLKRD